MGDERHRCSCLSAACENEPVHPFSLLPPLHTASPKFDSAPKKTSTVCSHTLYQIIHQTVLSRPFSLCSLPSLFSPMYHSASISYLTFTFTFCRFWPLNLPVWQRTLSVVPGSVGKGQRSKKGKEKSWFMWLQEKIKLHRIRDVKKQKGTAK